MKVQPSTLAASMTSSGTAVKPARSTIALNGNVRHTLTAMQAASARWGWPSQMGQDSDPYAPISPTRLSAQLMTLNCESYIHFQESTLIPMGSVNGMTTRPRMSFFPRNCWSRRKASDVPNRLLKIAATTRNTTLFWKAIRSEEHTSELQSRQYLVCRLLLEKKKKKNKTKHTIANTKHTTQVTLQPASVPSITKP